VAAASLCSTKPGYSYYRPHLSSRSIDVGDDNGHGFAGYGPLDLDQRGGEGVKVQVDGHDIVPGIQELRLMMCVVDRGHPVVIQWHMRELINLNLVVQEGLAVIHDQIRSSVSGSRTWFRHYLTRGRKKFSRRRGY
jgi:hypothetical protein